MQQQDEHQQPYSSDTALYDRYVASIFAYARLHTATWEDAEDLTLEVFLAALEYDNLSWLADAQQFIWLRRVAHNKLLDHYRHASRMPVVPLEQVLETVYYEEFIGRMSHRDILSLQASRKSWQISSRFPSPG